MSATLCLAWATPETGSLGLDSAGPSSGHQNREGDVRLTPKERAMLAGEQGPGVQRAIEIVVALGRIYGAEELVPVESVQVAGVSYKNLGRAGLEFLHEWAQEGGRVRVPTCLNPAGMDLRRWKELGIDETFARPQLQVIEAFAAMGIDVTCTCTPYHIGQVPSPGAHLAWAESSAVSFANSALGARTNREGGPSALAAAISGRTAKYGLHCQENRLGSVEVVVNCPVEEVADWGALGYLVGKQVQNGVPFFSDLGNRTAGELELVSRPDDSPFSSSLTERLKALGAAMAASGAVALYHIRGVTPEARAGNLLLAGSHHRGHRQPGTGPRGAITGGRDNRDRSGLVGLPARFSAAGGAIGCLCGGQAILARRLDHHQPPRAPPGKRCGLREGH